MTVRDLIEELEEYEDDQIVCVEDSGNYLNSVHFVTEKGLCSFYGENKNRIVTLILGGQLGMGIDNDCFGDYDTEVDE